MKDALGHGSEKRPIPGSPMHSKTNDELRFIQRDAHEAGRPPRKLRGPRIRMPGKSRPRVANTAWTFNGIGSDA